MVERREGGREGGRERNRGGLVQCVMLDSQVTET